MVQKEPKVFESFDLEAFNDPNRVVKTIKTYTADAIPWYLRTELFDRLLCMDGREPVGALYPVDKYVERRAHRSAVLEKISKGSPHTTSIIDRQVLGRTYGRGTEDLTRYNEQIAHLRKEARSGFQTVAIATNDTDPRNATSGSFGIVTFEDSPGVLVQPTRVGSLVLAQEGDETYDNAVTAFDAMFHHQATISELGQVSRFLSSLLTEK